MKIGKNLSWIPKAFDGLPSERDGGPKQTSEISETAVPTFDVFGIAAWEQATWESFFVTGAATPGLVTITNAESVLWKWIRWMSITTDDPASVKGEIQLLNRTGSFSLLGSTSAMDPDQGFAVPGPVVLLPNWSVRARFSTVGAGFTGRLRLFSVLLPPGLYLRV